MKKIILVLSAIMSSIYVNANYWQPNPNQFEYNMISIGVVVVDGVEQTVDSLEVGAFCNDECRGSALTNYNANFDRYYVFMTLYGNENDSLNFKIYDHRQNAELDLESLSVIVFHANGQAGTATEPFEFSFETVIPPVEYFEVTVVANPAESAVVSGSGTYENGSVCTVSASQNVHWFFENWTIDGVVVSTENEYSFVVTENVELTANLYYYNTAPEVKPDIFEIYPNPATNILIIKNIACEKIKILDATGRLVYTKENCLDNEIIDLQWLASGVYFVIIRNNVEKLVRR